MNTLHLYLRYLGVSVRGQLQYRGSTLMLVAGQIAIVGGEFLGLWALFDRFGSLQGWHLPEVALFYGITNVAFALTDGFARGWDTFSDLVRTGDFDRLLVRPRSLALQVASRELQLMRVGRLSVGVFVLIWALATLGVTDSLSQLLLVLASILGGACIFYGLFVLQATLSFWTIEGLEIMNVLTYGGTETSQYPLSIYRPSFRLFFTFVVPLACMNIIPAQGILPGGQRLGYPPWLPWIAPALGVLFMCICLQVWRVGVRHYCSTGS